MNSNLSIVERSRIEKKERYEALTLLGKVKWRIRRLKVKFEILWEKYFPPKENISTEDD